MISLTEDQLQAVAQELEMGMKCFVHKKTNEVVFLPDELRLNNYYDEELWQDQIDQLEESIHEYVRIEAMGTHESFEVMERFVETVQKPSLQERLYKALNRPKPFRNFKYEVDDAGEYRQKWFDFRDQENKEWVQRQIQGYNDLAS